ncbi:hypothetical protein M9H77_17384 [Catharanthus roseus]|uniref:Uncharacterized protein n=1 Tax=Catharanthus roseus TaxID=4058 RepID=A0ACC0B4E2_CATRO|nr:hypothetical protein M9H77_17384 [Catharanthus roseus]
MAFSSSSSAIKVVLQSIDGKTLEVDEVVAKQFVTIEHLLEDRLTRTGPMVIPNIFGDILAKIVKCYIHVLILLGQKEGEFGMTLIVYEKAPHHIYCRKCSVVMARRVFDGTILHSLYLDKYVYLKTRAMLSKDRTEKERRMAILQRELEARKAALNAQGNGWAVQRNILFF